MAMAILGTGAVVLQQSAVVESYTVTELPSGEEIFLGVLEDTVVLKGMIIKLDCCGKQLTALDADDL